MLDYLTIIFVVDLNYIFAIMSMILIRKAKANDMVSVLDLIKELAEFEREPKSVILNVSDLINDGFCNNPKFRCIVAEIKNKVVGMALFLSLIHI